MMKKQIFFSAMILTCGATYLNACVSKSENKCGDRDELLSFQSRGMDIKSKNDISQAYNGIANDLDRANQRFLDAQELFYEQDLSVKNEAVEFVFSSIGSKIQGLKFLFRGGICHAGVLDRLSALKCYTVKLIADQTEQHEMKSKIEILEDYFSDLYKNIEKLDKQAEVKAKELNVSFATDIACWD
jgi:hypothetical protein